MAKHAPFPSIENTVFNRETRAYRPRLARDASVGRREAPRSFAQGVFDVAKLHQKRIECVASLISVQYQQSTVICIFY